MSAAHPRPLLRTPPPPDACDPPLAPAQGIANGFVLSVALWGLIMLAIHAALRLA